MAAAFAAMTKGGCRGTTALQGRYASLLRKVFSDKVMRE